ncbi:hypothetical protein Sjap_015251 [Stephania japonica]|uniref:Uncharacterized protein n=1 Tax=Stephania japonica TaxID=461633 RepID=A0AAP0NSB8_9MAGN
MLKLRLFIVELRQCVPDITDANVDTRLELEFANSLSVGDATYQEDEPTPFTIEVGNEGLHVLLADPTGSHMTEEEEVNEHDDKLSSSSKSQTSIIKMTDCRSGFGSGHGPPSGIGQGGRVQTLIGRGCGRGRVQNLQHLPRQDDHIPPAPLERGLALIRPPPPSVIRRPAIRLAPFGPPSHPSSRPQLTEGATHDSPSSSTHPSTPSSAPQHLPNVEMPYDPAPPPELTGEKDMPRIRITIKNKSLHPSDVYAQKMTDTFKKGMIRRGSIGNLYRNIKETYTGRDGGWSYFDWNPQITALIMTAYESKVKVRYKALMNKLLTQGERPIYVIEEAWRRYVEYWESDDFKARSKIASSNRQTKKGGSGTGMSKHTGGSIPFLVHEEQLSKELGRDCTVLELYLHVHTKKHDG